MTMELRPYLVQRANFAEREGKEGIDGILKFDYMGSSEFEWGALPKSLKRVREDISEYTYLDVPMPNDVVITVCCKEEIKSEIKRYLAGLMNRKYRLKEFSDFEKLFDNPKKEFYRECETDFWWDIKNDLMFWQKNPEFEEKFKSKIK